MLLEEGVCYDQCILLTRLLAFVLLHFVLQVQTCLLLQVYFLTSCFCIPVPYDEKTSFLVLVSCRSWRRQWHPTPVLLPGKSHGRGSLVGCSPWGRKQPDTTDRLRFHFSLSCIGEGNGNPLQGSCLENPQDGGAWWAAIYGVTQSRT